MHSKEETQTVNSNQVHYFKSIARKTSNQQLSIPTDHSSPIVSFDNHEKESSVMQEILEEQRTTKKQIPNQLSTSSLNSPKLSASKLSNNSKDTYYLYWKSKALQYQQQNFTLRTLNDELKQQISALKQSINKLQNILNHQSQSTNKQLQLQTQLHLNTQTQKQLYLHIDKLSQQLAIQKNIAKVYEKKYQTNQNQKQAIVLKELRNKVKQLTTENIQYHYIIKQYQQYFKQNGIKSIWNQTEHKRNKTEISHYNY